MDPHLGLKHSDLICLLILGSTASGRFEKPSLLSASGLEFPETRTFCVLGCPLFTNWHPGRQLEHRWV